MDSFILGLFMAVVGIGVGAAIGYVIRENKSKRGLEEAEKRAQELVAAAELKQNEALAKAKEKAIKYKFDLFYF